MKQNSKPLILVTNDDGIHALGLKALVEIASEFGNIVVVAPNKGNSAKSHAVTLDMPVYYEKIKETPNIQYFSCSGTPVDCVKMGLSILKCKPDFVVSGINHGSNASVNLLYSGTMGAAIEGCLNGIPSIGFSLTSHVTDADLEPAKHFSKRILEQVTKHGLANRTCLNVNIPHLKKEQIKGIKICRQTEGVWSEDFEERTHPNGKTYYWLTGSYENLEPESTDTDIWAIENDYVAVVPVKTNLTDINELERLKKIEF